MALPEIIKDLLENGVHFGHLSKYWNPKMKKFIFGRKKNVYIIDLEKTAKCLDEAKDFVRKVAQDGGKILFVGTKKQLRGIVKECAQDCGMPSVAERWVGGLLTNFGTIHRQILKYKSMLAKVDEGGLEKMPGKEVVRFKRELSRMEKNYSGMIDLEDLPDCVCLVDPKKEAACVSEANRLSIPVIALVDTDSDPDPIDYPVPGNDDAIKSVKCVMTHLVAAVKEGVAKGEQLLAEAKAEKERQKAEALQVAAKRDQVKEAKITEEVEEDL